jgi:hypothetical protein
MRALEGGADAVFERLMKPHTGRTAGHYHLDFEERFEVLEGTATIEREGRTIRAGPGESVAIERGLRHVNAYNARDEDLRLRHVVSPRSEFAECFGSALGHHMEHDTVNAQGEFPNLQLFVILHATREQSYRAGLPIPLQRPVIFLGALLGRLRGFKRRYD